MTTAAVDRFLGRRLQVFVNRQHEVVARHGHLAPEALDRPAGDIDLDLVAAVLAAHVLIVDLFEAELADDVAGLVALIFLIFEFLIIDLADIAERMSALLLQHVVADRLVLDHDTRIEVFLFLDDRDDVGRDIRLDPDGVEAAVRRNLRLDVLDWHVDELREALDHVVLDWRRQWQERNGEARAVRHEELAVAVVERAARRHRRDDADAVAVRKSCIVIALINLQIPGTPNQDGDDEHHADAEDAETALVAVVSFVFH